MIHPNLLPAEYHALCHPDKSYETISAGRLNALKNPFRERWAEKPNLETPGIIRGALVDCLWLTPKLFPSMFIMVPDNAPRKPSISQINAKKPSEETIKAIGYWKAFNERAKGKYLITEELLEKCKFLVETLNAHPDSREIHNVSEPQVVVSSEAPAMFGHHGYFNKIMIDLLPEDISAYGDSLVDLKVYTVIEDDEISRWFQNYDVHVRAAHYLDTYNEGKPESWPPRTRYILLIIEGETGEIKVVEMDNEDVEDGRQIIQSRLRKFEDFIGRGCPRVAYNRGIRVIGRPSWAKRRDIMAGDMEPSTDTEIE